MELVTHKKLKGGRLMPWGKGTVVTGAKGFVFLAGNTATAEDYEPVDVETEASHPHKCFGRVFKGDAIARDSDFPSRDSADALLRSSCADG